MFICVNALLVSHVYLSNVYMLSTFNENIFYWVSVRIQSPRIKILKNEEKKSFGHSVSSCRCFCFLVPGSQHLTLLYQFGNKTSIVVCHSVILKKNCSPRTFQPRTQKYNYGHLNRRKTECSCSWSIQL